MDKDISFQRENMERNQTVCSKCKCSKGKVSNGQKQAPFLDDLVQWNDNENDEDPSFFWRAHTISVLLLLLLALCYVALFETPETDHVYNAKRGLFACIVVFLAFGTTQARDGPFVRPHPVFWRFILCCSVVYELSMIFILFQSSNDARSWMSYFDPSLGKPLPEMDYGSNCVFYDSEHSDPFHNLKTKFDWFVPAHLFGWWAKAIILRDFWFANALSILFEIYEYSLEHQLPNFHECWWDHWIMDALLCNGVGIYLGMKTCQYLEIKEYHWRSLWKIPTYTGKLKRAAEQFTPYRWDSFKWEATASLKRWLATIGITIMFSLAELNCFYMKFVLWINPEHWLIVARLILIGFAGVVAIREIYQYMDDAHCKRFGQQSWILAAIIITETLICFKFGMDTISVPPPTYIIIFWSILLTGLAVYTMWRFFPSCIKSTSDDDDDEHFVKEYKME